MAEVIYTPRALADLEEISEYIARGNPDRAKSFVAELRDHCTRAADNPLSYVRRDDIARGARMALHERYRILFRVLADRIEIVRIVHGARRV